MIRKWLSALLILIAIPPHVGAIDDHEGYLEAFRKEINNRALASSVVPALARAYEGEAQGAFWQAYEALESAQKPIYLAKSRCHDVSAGTFTNWVKAKVSFAFARIFNGAFISMMAVSTQSYVDELLLVDVLDSPNEQLFWKYVIAQEQAQALAFGHAEQGNFQEATRILMEFKNLIPSLYNVLSHC